MGVTNLYYDNNGNLTDDGTYDYIYDIFNRLIEVQYNSATVAEYGYDYSGRRISKTVYGGSTVTTTAPTSMSSNGMSSRLLIGFLRKQIKLDFRKAKEGIWFYPQQVRDNTILSL